MGFFVVLAILNAPFEAFHTHLVLMGHEIKMICPKKNNNF